MWLLAMLITGAHAAATPTVLVLGDSISAGYGIPAGSSWVELLERELEQRNRAYAVVNASISGEISSGALRRLPRLLQDYQPAVVIVEIGGNDGLRGQPVGQLRDNLEQIVKLSREQGADVLLLGMRIPPNYGKRYSDQFFDAYTQVAEQLQVPLVPFLLDGVALDPALMQDDRIHPSTEAQPLILQKVMPALESILD